MTTPAAVRTPFSTLPGAVLGTGADAGVPAHYGAPLPEQRALARGRAVVDLSQLGIVTVRGEDRLTWLDSLTSQRLALEPGESSESLVLSPQGRIEFEFGILDDGETAYLITEGASAEPLRAFLHRMRFRMRVEVEDRSDELFAIGEIAPSSTSDPADLGAAAPNGVPLIWTDPWAFGRPGGTSYAAVPADSHPGRTYRLRLHLLDTAARAALVDRIRTDELGAAGTLALEALRVAAWRPRAAGEFDERILPHELDLLRSAVHLDKGCYRGQETVAKVHNLGHPPRRLALLDLDGTDGRLPPHGALIRLDAEGRPVGRVTSAAMHWEEGPIALALLKRNVDPDAQLLVDLEAAPQPDPAAADAAAGDGAPAVTGARIEQAPGAPERVDARQTVIVRPDAGHAVDVPRFARRRAPHPGA